MEFQGLTARYAHPCALAVPDGRADWRIKRFGVFAPANAAGYVSMEVLEGPQAGQAVVPLLEAILESLKDEDEKESPGQYL